MPHSKPPYLLVEIALNRSNSIELPFSSSSSSSSSRSDDSRDKRRGRRGKKSRRSRSKSGDKGREEKEKADPAKEALSATQALLPSLLPKLAANKLLPPSKVRMRVDLGNYVDNMTYTYIL